MLDKQYWSNRYENQQTGWDLGVITPPLKNYFEGLKNKELKILIPGAGNGYEVEYLFQSGFKNVYIMDIVQYPLTQFSIRCPEFPSQHILCGDFFEYNTQRFDLIIEHTFFCALPKNNRASYFKKMYELLNPLGLLAGLWFNVPLNETEPPFGGNIDEYQSLFTPYFNLKNKFNVDNSINKRQGQEVFMELLKK
jgi:thiopurine S-methyltransferase